MNPFYGIALTRYDVGRVCALAGGFNKLKSVIKMDQETATGICKEWATTAVYKNGSPKERRLNVISYALFYPNASLKLLQYNIDNNVFRYTYYENGKLQEQLTFNERLQKHGQCVKFHENGNTMRNYAFNCG